MKRDSETQVYAPPEMLVKSIIGALMDMSVQSDQMASRFLEKFMRIDPITDELEVRDDRINELPDFLRNEIDHVLQSENRIVDAPKYLAECLRHVEQRGSKSLTIPMQKLDMMRDQCVSARSISKIAESMNEGDQ